MRNTKIKKGIYRHYKGNYYELIDIARHSETLEELVVYKALYGDGGIWVRPISMWCEKVKVNGKTVSRFTYIEDKISIEKSCGSILYKKEDGIIKYLVLMQRHSKTWSLPKGHMEKGETKQQTAMRETFEETSIKVQLADDFEGRISYMLKNGNLKHVYFFIATPDTDISDLKVDNAEIKSFKWLSRKDAAKLLPSCATLLKNAEDFILKQKY